MAAIRNSLEILNDPVYQEKTPSLPWDIYIYKSHQERTAALGGLRENCGNLQFVREVMESAQYIHASQLEASRMRGEPMQPQWQYAYEAAQYHCGIFSLSDLLHALEGIYTCLLYTSQKGSVCESLRPVLSFPALRIRI